MTTILVLDDDLGFVVYFCLALARAGYTAVPATTVEGVRPLLRGLGLSKIDLMIVNFCIPGTLGLVEAVASRRRKVIQIEDPRVARIKLIPVDGTLRKARAVGPAAESRWLRMVRRVLGEAA